MLLQIWGWVAYEGAGGRILLIICFTEDLCTSRYPQHLKINNSVELSQKMDFIQATAAPRQIFVPKTREFLYRALALFTVPLRYVTDGCAMVH